jgi:hypothetical protein
VYGVDASPNRASLNNQESYVNTVGLLASKKGRLAGLGNVLESFIADCREAITRKADAADRVCQAPFWTGLIDSWCKGGRVGGSR